MGCGASKKRPQSRTGPQPASEHSRSPSTKSMASRDSGDGRIAKSPSDVISETDTDIQSRASQPPSSMSAGTEVATETQRATRGKTHSGAPPRVSPLPSSNDAHAVSHPHMSRLKQDGQDGDDDVNSLQHPFSLSAPMLGNEQDGGNPSAHATDAGSSAKDHFIVAEVVDESGLDITPTIIQDDKDKEAVQSIQALARGILHRKVQAVTNSIPSPTDRPPLSGGRRSGSVSPAMTDSSQKGPSPISRSSSQYAGVFALVRQSSSAHIKRQSKNMFKGPVIPAQGPVANGSHRRAVVRTPSWHGKKRLSPSSNLSPSGSETSLMSSQVTDYT